MHLQKHSPRSHGQDCPSRPVLGLAVLWLRGGTPAAGPGSTPPQQWRVWLQAGMGLPWSLQPPFPPSPEVWAGAVSPPPGDLGKRLGRSAHISSDCPLEKKARSKSPQGGSPSPGTGGPVTAGEGITATPHPVLPQRRDSAAAGTSAQHGPRGPLPPAGGGAE